MNRACFTLEIRSGQEERYDRLHTEMPFSLKAAIAAAGFTNYTLFRRDTNVIGYVEADPDFDTCIDLLGSSRAFSEWAQDFAGVFVEQEGNVAHLTSYEEVWHVD